MSSQTFSYDQLNRITAAQTTSTYASSPLHCWGETYGVDAWGNLQSIAATTNTNYTGCSQESGFSRAADGNNHLVGFSYDLSGNTTSDSVYSYNWNAESQLKSANNVNYLYDGNGRRVAKVGSKLYWYGAGSEILAETNAAGNTTAEYVFFGGKRIAMLPAGSNPIYYVEDLLGTSRVTTTNTGVVCYDADFYPYGGERYYTNTCSQNNYKFEGKERDLESGNDEFGARYYSNRFGRWLSADWSAVPAPVPYANFTNPQTLNLYAMVSDDPESFADLDGHCCDIGQVINFVGAAMNAYGSDNLAGVGRQDQINNATTEGKLGAATGDAIATIQGGMEVLTGGVSEVLGVGLDMTGGGAVLGVPINIASAGLIAHGAVTSTEGAAHLGAAAGDAINGGLSTPAESRSSGPKEGSAGGPSAGKRASPKERQQALQENNGKCVFCGKKATEADHAIAKSKGGNTTPENLQPTCMGCNRSKGTKSSAEFQKKKKKG